MNPQVDLEHATEVVRRSVKAAAAALRYFQKDFVIETKADLTPVTVAARAATARAITADPDQAERFAGHAGAHHVRGTPTGSLLVAHMALALTGATRGDK